jgi:hypothetical protein
VYIFKGGWLISCAVMAVNDEFIGCKIIELDVEPRLPIVDGAIFQKEIKILEALV